MKRVVGERICGILSWSILSVFHKKIIFYWQAYYKNRTQSGLKHHSKHLLIHDIYVNFIRWQPSQFIWNWLLSDSKQDLFFSNSIVKKGNPKRAIKWCLESELVKLKYWKKRCVIRGCIPKHTLTMTCSAVYFLYPAPKKPNISLKIIPHYKRQPLVKKKLHFATLIPKSNMEGRGCLTAIRASHW